MLTPLAASEQELIGGGFGTYQKELPITPATAVRADVFGGSTPTLDFPRSSAQGGGGVPNPRSGWALS